MAINIFNLRKWSKMLCGKSILHVNQGVGKMYDFKELKGYYNDLTEKVTKDEEHYNTIEVFTTKINGKITAYFPISIFQYGLGAYDLYLLDVKDKELMWKKFEVAARWAYDNIGENGAWDAFGFLYKDAPHSAMAQGEGASLLLRYYKETKDNNYLLAAIKAIDFMLTDISEGGTSKSTESGIVLYEFTCKPFVFNGWMFAIFGLIDICVVLKEERYEKALENTILAFKSRLPLMDNGYWSKYWGGKNIASPFYHSLHIAQLQILYEYTNDQEFKKIIGRFISYRNSKRNRRKAFVKKVFQKILERQ